MVSDLVVSFRETVLEKLNHTVMSKSPNKHNCLYFEAKSLEEELAEAIDEGYIGPQRRSQVLQQDSATRVEQQDSIRRVEAKPIVVKYGINHVTYLVE